MKHVDAIIISWAKNENLLQVTRNCLDSLFSSERGMDVTFHAYIVESNHDVNYDDFNVLYRRHTTTTIHTDEEFGYHKYLNIGRKLGNSPYVVLCNSDLTFENDWASRIIEVMEKYPKIMSASPWCPQTQGDNDTDTWRNRIFMGYKVRDEVAGWCIFQKREIYDLIGDLDERFKFWYCDRDYALELKTRNIPHCLITSSVVNHHNNHTGKTGETVSDEALHEITTAQESVFMEKWGDLDRNEGLYFLHEYVDI